MVTDQKIKQEGHSDASQEIFKDVTYFIVGDVSADVLKLLDSHGAKRDLYLSDIVSHVIADSTEPEEYSEAKDLFERPVVSSQWVILSVKCGKQLPKEVFALEGRLFSRVKVCPHQLDAEDAKAIWGMVTFHGGQCQMKLDSSVTHLITTSTTGEKYDVAMQHGDSVKVVTPDWVTDSVANKQLMEEIIYHPKLITPPKPETPPRPELPPITEVPMQPSEIQPKVEPMEVSPIPGMVPFLPGHSPGAARRKSSSSDEAYKTNGSRPGTPSAKEALARMVSSRLYAGGKSDIPEMAMPRSGLSPIMSQGPRSVSPGGQGVPPMSSAAGLPAVPHSMGMPTSGPGRAGLGPGVPGQSGMGHTSMGMVHPGIPVSHAAMTSSGMPHPGMPHPGTVPHPGHDSSGMPSGGIPSGGIPNPAMATTGMGMPAVPSSMHMQMSGAGMPPHHPPPQHAQAQFPPGFTHAPPQHPHQLQQQQQQQQQRQHQLQQLHQHMQQQQQQMQQQQQQLQQQQLQQQQQQQLQQMQQHHQQLLQQQHQQQMHQQQIQQQLHQQQMQQLQQQQQTAPPPTPPQPKKRQSKQAQQAAAQAPQQQPPQLQAQQQAANSQAGRDEGAGARATLRNITNNSASPPAARPSAPVKINQMLGMGGQSRPPPPAYPYPPQSPGSQPQQPPLPPPPPQQQTPHIPYEYFGHETPENIPVPPEHCLLGCVFYMCDYQSTVGAEETNTWTQIIEQYGGKVSPVYSEAVTHVLCCDQKADPVKQKALEDEKRMVTAFWLNDCLLQKKMQPPWQALHIPLMFTTEKPCKNQIISITNFMGEERKRVKQMINAIGAKYTGYMTRSNSVLVCKRPGGMKFEKAKEWRVPVVNVQWLSDLVLGQMDALRLPVQMRYLQVGHARDFCADLGKAWQWMLGWRKPVKVTKEMLQKVAQLPKKTIKTEADSTTEPAAKKRRLDEDSPPPSNETAPRIIFTGYPRTVVKRLTAIAEKLGGHVTENPQHCTHLVSQKLTRTIKFFHAINVANHIVTKEWLEESSLQGRFLEEEKYQLKDEAGEREVGCNLQESLRKAKTSPIFQGLVFYITPGVIPPAEELKKVIESAGGAVLKRRPSAKTTTKMRDDKGRSTFIVISCPNDLHLCRDLKAQKIDVYSAEMALTGVLRQELDWKMYRLDYQLYAV